MLSVIDKRIERHKTLSRTPVHACVGAFGGYLENLVTFSLLSVPPINRVELPGLPCFMCLADIREPSEHSFEAHAKSQIRIQYLRLSFG